MEHLYRPKSLRRKYVTNLHHLGSGSDFLDTTVKGQATKENNRNTGLLKDFVLKTTIKQLDTISHNDGYYKNRLQKILAMIWKNWGLLCTNDGNIQIVQPAKRNIWYKVFFLKKKTI